MSYKIWRLTFFLEKKENVDFLPSMIQGFYSLGCPFRFGGGPPLVFTPPLRHNITPQGGASLRVTKAQKSTFLARRVGDQPPTTTIQIYVVRP